MKTQRTWNLILDLIGFTGFISVLVLAISLLLAPVESLNGIEPEEPGPLSSIIEPIEANIRTIVIEIDQFIINSTTHPSIYHQ